MWIVFMHVPVLIVISFLKAAPEGFMIKHMTDIDYISIDNLLPLM